VGERVPEFSLPGLDGDPVSFEMLLHDDGLQRMLRGTGSAG
jgi:hypothetical protein